MSDLNDVLKDSYIGKVATALQPYAAELTVTKFFWRRKTFRTGVVVIMTPPAGLCAGYLAHGVVERQAKNLDTEVNGVCVNSQPKTPFSSSLLFSFWLFENSKTLF